jgi:hypothetical protein
MTTDNHTPDPALALLITARLAEIRDDADTCREAIEEGELDFKPCDQAVYDAAYRLIAEGTRALLAHLDALTPRAPVDGEALGRRAWRERASPESRAERRHAERGSMTARDNADATFEEEEAIGYWCNKCGTPYYYCGCPETDDVVTSDQQPPSGREENPIREPWGPAR